MRAFWSFSGCNCMILSLGKKKSNPKLVCIYCYTNCVTLILRDTLESAATRLSVLETPGSLVGHFMRLFVCKSKQSIKILHTQYMMQQDCSFLCIFFQHNLQDIYQSLQHPESDLYQTISNSARTVKLNKPDAYAQESDISVIIRKNTRKWLHCVHVLDCNNL